MRYYMIATGTGADKQYVNTANGTRLVSSVKEASYFDDLASADAEIDFNLNQKFPEKLFLVIPILT